MCFERKLQRARALHGPATPKFIFNNWPHQLWTECAGPVNEPTYKAAIVTISNYPLILNKITPYSISSQLCLQFGINYSLLNINSSAMSLQTRDKRKKSGAKYRRKKLARIDAEQEKLIARSW